MSSTVSPAPFEIHTVYHSTARNVIDKVYRSPERLGTFIIFILKSTYLPVFGFVGQASSNKYNGPPQPRKPRESSFLACFSSRGICHIWQLQGTEEPDGKNGEWHRSCYVGPEPWITAVCLGDIDAKRLLNSETN
jgi:hypothetical protein